MSQPNTRTVHDEFNALIAFQVEAARMATIRAQEAEQRLAQAAQQIAALKQELAAKAPPQALPDVPQPADA